ncbi:MAG: energy transducer TonB, partial [Vicinamibacterales bacterium]
KIVLHAPAYTIRDTDVSPKLVAVFQDVRRRALPIAARSLYSNAKAAYDAKQWADAKTQFAELTRILSDPDLAAQQATLADLRELGDGFLKLAENEIAEEARRTEEAAEQRRQEEAAAAKQAEEAKAAAAAAASAQAAPGAAAAAPAPSGAARPSPAATLAGTAAQAASAVPAATNGGAGSAGAADDDSAPQVPVYTVANPEVTPPVEVQRTFPRWSPPTRAMALLIQTGLLEIVVDEKGAVQSARMAKTVFPTYDALLVAAARDWKFTPAMREGRPVRYRQLLEIVLRPQQ